MPGITAAQAILLNKGMSILHKTQLGTILYNQLAPLSFPAASTDGFVKYDTAGTAMETQTYAAAGAVTGNVPDQATAAGTAKTVARGDHAHACPCAAAVTLTPATTNAEGDSTSFARANHTHACTCAAPAQQTIAAAAAEGTAASFARSDHAHTFTTAAAGTAAFNQAAGEGTATSFSRSDHTHATKGSVMRFSQVIGFADITDPGATHTIVLTSPPTNAIFLGGCIELDDAFTDLPGTATLTAQIGDAADPNEMADAVAIGSGEALGIKDGIPTASLTWEGVQAAYAPAVLFTGSVNLNTLTAGSCIVHLYYIQCEVVTP